MLAAYKLSGLRGDRAGLCQPPPSAGRRPAFVAGRDGDLEGAGPDAFTVGAFSGAHETTRAVSLATPRGQKVRLGSGEKPIGIPLSSREASKLGTKHVVCLTC